MRSSYLIVISLSIRIMFRANNSTRPRSYIGYNNNYYCGMGTMTEDGKRLNGGKGDEQQVLQISHGLGDETANTATIATIQL